MWKNKKFNEKLERNLGQVEDYYADDFEDFDFGDEIDIIETPVSPLMSLESTAESVSPEMDSVGNELNSKDSKSVVYELMSSLESEYDEPTSSQNFNFRTFQEALEEVSSSKRKRFKNGTRSSLTFSNEKVRQIERDNQILLNKIMKSGPSGDGIHNDKLLSHRQQPKIRSSAEVNRRKMQQKINYENEILKQKLDKIAGRRPL